MKRMQFVAIVVLASSLTFWGQGMAQTPKRGGILSTFLNGDPTRLDVHQETGLQAQQATAGVYSGLLHIDPNDGRSIVGDLAKSWQFSNGGKTVTFALHENVKWHDGRPFSSEDVKASFDRLLDPKFRSPRCGGLVRPLVDSVSVVNANTVRFELKFPTKTIENSLASSWCRVVAKHILERDGDLQRPESQIGTGPFKFERYTRDSIVEWVRNPDYFRSGLPHLDGVKLFIIPDKNRALSAAKAGQLHLWTTSPALTTSQAMELKNARGDQVTIYDTPTNAIWGVIPHNEKGPFTDPDLRMAAHLAMDRKELFEKNQEGIGTPCAILDPGLYGDFALPLSEVEKLPGCRSPKSLDIQEGKRLVAKNYPGGVDVDMIARTTGGDFVNQTQLVAAQLAKVGIRANIRLMEGAAGLAAYRSGEFEAIGSQATGMISSDPVGVFSLAFYSKSARNWGRLSDVKVDAWIDEAQREQDRGRKIEILHKMQRYLLSEAPASLVVGWANGWYFYDNRLNNYHHPPTSYDNNTYMSVWLE